MTLAPPLHAPCIETPAPYGAFARALDDRLERLGIYPRLSAQQARIILSLSDEQKTNKLLSVSSTQSTRQYSLGLSVTFSLRRPDSTPLAGPETLGESRTLTLASSQILSSSNEADTLYRQMRTELIEDLLGRLSSGEITDKIQ